VAKEPIQLSKFMAEERASDSEDSDDETAARSVISGKKIKMKVKKSKQTKMRDQNREQLLQFLNAQY